MSEKKILVTTLRCSMCSINWPMLKEYSDCPICESTCFTNQIDKDDILSHAQAQARILESKQEVEEEATFNSIHPAQVFSHRFAVFMDLGFGPAEAALLAHTREDTHRVKRMLRQGCDLNTAVAILL